ncbi:MAG: hypothetical protein KQJ78_24225 [Deltaproteobacteria bacterium]|nr:hypothetical protein [Deltaproteobacteria bacterium]
MVSDFAIDLQWTASLCPQEGRDEIRHTASQLTMTLKGSVVTKNEDDWARSVKDYALVSLYPVALWFASSWWRILYEPSPENSRTAEWRMNHELIAAGYGYIWPNICFASDGVNLSVQAFSSLSEIYGPTRYLVSEQAVVALPDFKRTLGGFIRTVIARLELYGLFETDLQVIWKEVAEEENDSVKSEFRRLEACLGFDPDTAPKEFVEDLLSLSKDVGIAGLTEVACSRPFDENQIKHIQDILRLSRRNDVGIVGKIDLRERMECVRERMNDQKSTPWELGWRIARAFRKDAGWYNRPLKDEDLESVLNIPARHLLGEKLQEYYPSVGLGIRENGGEYIRFHFQKRNNRARRFEAARFMADSIFSRTEDKWLPITNAKTFRQKVQRAFAAELLCPIEELKKQFSCRNYSEDDINDAADYFEVSPFVVQGLLVNTQTVSKESIASYLNEA